MRPTLATLALLPLLACAPLVPVGPSVSLPPDAVQGAGDPTRSAILSSAYAFNNAGGLADPAVAARALANMDYLANNLPQDPRYSFAPTLAGQMVAARAELRGALGVAPGAPSQQVVDELYGVSRALRARDLAGAENALSPAIFPDRRATVLRLASLPPLPATATAAASAEREQTRADNDRMIGRGAGSTGGRH